MTSRRTFIKQTALGAMGIGIMGSFPACTSKLPGMVGKGSGPLPRSTPEAQGIPSAAIRDFLSAVQKSGQEFHSFMVIRHGRPMEAMQADPEGKWGKLPANRGWQGSAASERQARIAVRGGGAVLQKH